MAKLFEGIDDALSEFIRAQHIFFVATAPLAAEGHINLSPKGLDTFRILAPDEVAYLDLTGSGIETVAHLRENGRIVFMFCAFEGRPRILRLHGSAAALEPGSEEFEELKPSFPDLPGARAIIRARIERVADSCGYAVPIYALQRERDQLLLYAERKGPEGIREAQRDANRLSIDGLSGLRGVQ